MKSVKTLYVSDLDGTLFNRKKKVSDPAAETINRCIEKGMLFSVATARMPYGCDYRLSDLHLNTPGILTNGVFLYDFENKKYLSVEIMEEDATKKVIKLFKEHDMSCFVYLYKEEKINIYYDDPKLEEQTQYYSERALLGCGEVRKVDSYQELNLEQTVYITYTGSEEELQPLCRELNEIKGIQYAYYLNIYNGLYCLEIFSENANKENALRKLKKLVECDEVVVFGDNLNDLPMIRIADRSYAPENALDEVKKCVNGVLADCDNDGVARFLAEEWSVSYGL